MKISNSNYNYNNSSINSNNSRIHASNEISRFSRAYNVDISDRAKLNPEYNSKDNYFPTYNSEVLQYSKNLNLVYK